jgi:hypothetical protein
VAIDRTVGRSPGDLHPEEAASGGLIELGEAEPREMVLGPFDFHEEG